MDENFNQNYQENEAYLSEEEMLKRQYAKKRLKRFFLVFLFIDIALLLFIIIEFILIGIGK